jgi:hypothetical protein
MIRILPINRSQSIFISEFNVFGKMSMVLISRVNLRIKKRRRGAAFYRVLKYQFLSQGIGRGSLNLS